MMYILYKDDYYINYERLEIEEALIEDAEEVLALQRLAYRSEAEINNDFSIQPLTQTEKETVEDFRKQTVLKVSAVNCKNGSNTLKAAKKIIASVRGYQEKDSCHIGKLIVHPEYQNMGIGSELLGVIERQFSGAARYELFTGGKSARNIRLYERSGYKPIKIKKVNDMLSLVFMEKLAGG
jgi:ribosomal protein S18 acetylase RimI-like enzyme